MTGHTEKAFYGKYRGTVVDNADPERLARLLVHVPSIFKEASWALPCVPYAGLQVGLYAIPPIGAMVWVEFEAGNPNSPIWSGCFWGADEMPEEAAGPEILLLKTAGLKLILNSLPGEGGFTLEAAEPVVEVPITLTINADGFAVRIAENNIELSESVIAINFAETYSKLSEAGVETQCGSSSVFVTEENVLLKNGEAAAGVSSAGVTAHDGETAMNVASGEIKMACAPSVATIGAEGIALHAGASAVAVTDAGVNINDGALEVLP